MGHRRYCRRKLPIQTAVCAEFRFLRRSRFRYRPATATHERPHLQVRPHRKSGTRCIHQFLKETPATMSERMESHGVRAC